ncbi:MAG: hypothetical protein ABIH34_00300 [Nanoarchaeota archaeon]
MATIDDTVLEADKRFFDFVVITELVAGGTGPARYLGENQFQSTLVFDTCVRDEGDLPEPWADPLLQGIRSMSTVAKNERPAGFNELHHSMRKEAWHKYIRLYDIVRDAVINITHPVIRESRMADLEVVKGLYDLAGHEVGATFTMPSILTMKRLVTGSGHVPTYQEFRRQITEMSAEYSKLGFKGTLIEQAKAFDEGIGEVDKEHIVPSFRELSGLLVPTSERLLGLEPGTLQFEVVALPESEHKGGSNEYAGNYTTRISIKPHSKTSKLRLAHLTCHEMTHTIQSVAQEQFYNETGSVRGAFGTMCTSTMATDEGVAEHGVKTFDIEVQQYLGDAYQHLALHEKHVMLKTNAGLIATLNAFPALLRGDDPQDIRDDVEAIACAAGFDEERVNVIANGVMDPLRLLKNFAYTPFYGENCRIVDQAFGNRLFADSFQRYQRAMSKMGPIALPVLSQAMDAFGK